MSIAASLPPGDKSLVPISSAGKTFTIEEKHYTLSTNYYDIGDYLEKLKIQQYQSIFITLKGGSYLWEKLYKMPYNSKLILTGENYQNGGKSNKVSILMGEKHSSIINKEEYRNNTRLIIQGGCTCKIEGINFFIKMNDNKRMSRDPLNIGIFTLMNGVLYLTQGMIESADSPIINVPGQSIAKIYFGHTFFDRNPMSFNNEIQVVETLVGYGFSGNKVFVSKSHTHLGNGCILKSSNKIELID